MPISKGYGYTVKPLFGNADKEVIVRHKNNTKDLNIDPDTSNVGGGICSGITTAWLVMFLNDNQSAYPAQFEENFEVTRFQGAYFKELHGKTPDHIEKMDKVLDSRLRELNRQQQRLTSGLSLPTASKWGAYLSIWGHAVGIGKAGNKYYIMDPNFGLFVYNSKSDFLADVQTLVEARAARKKQNSSAKFGAIFFDQSKGLGSKK
ncbi:MAG: hypothetical protein MI810_24945 [Flavobacteriales bacterium]|nr:hypothetical protein [Flavobacteriales bacterium]